MQLQLQRLASDYAQGDRLAAFGALLLLLQLQSSPAAALLAAGRPAAAQGMHCTCFACALTSPNFCGTQFQVTTKAQHLLSVYVMVVSFPQRVGCPTQYFDSITS